MATPFLDKYEREQKQQFAWLYAIACELAGDHIVDRAIRRNHEYDLNAKPKS